MGSMWMRRSHGSFGGADMCLVKKCGLFGVLALLLCDDGRGRCKFMDLQFRRFGGDLFKTKNGKISFVGSEKIKNNRIIGTHC